MQLNHGGWSREITVRELPVSTTIAGVNMRLTPGGVRELHWHKQSEWAYMILGHARITAVDQDGRNFIADVGPGDLWFFPAGIPHSIQGLEDGCEFLLVLTTGTSPSSIPSRLQIGSHTHRKMFWPRISVYTKAPSPASPTNSDTSSKQKCRDRSKTKKCPTRMEPYQKASLTGCLHKSLS